MDSRQLETILANVYQFEYRFSTTGENSGRLTSIQLLSSGDTERSRIIFTDLYWFVVISGEYMIPQQSGINTPGSLASQKIDLPSGPA